MSIEQLFFELIRVAIGTQESLSRLPSAREWGELYKMAQKQSLVGVCFVAVQRLTGVKDSIHHTPYTINLPETLYLTWMGMTAQIQKKNETVDEQCAELQAKLSAEGLRSCILKGQGVASLYTSTGSAQVPSYLRGLRQSGDIDVWVDADAEKALRWVRKYQMKLDFDYKHVHLDAFDDTTVEVHYRPSISRVPWRMKAVERFTKKNACWNNCIELGGDKVNVPSLEFNLVFILQHIYGHLFAEEMSLKQYLDYYFVLQKAHENGADVQEAYRWMECIGMGRFAKATMWLMHEVFGLAEKMMLCAMDEKEGRFL